MDPTAAFDAVERAESRAERLQLRLDEQSALVGNLRKQLRQSSESTMLASQQVRMLHGAHGAGTPGSDSIVGLQRTVANLCTKLDLEKKAANGVQAERQRLEKQLATGARERQTLLATQQELRTELKRRSSELERALAALKESGNSYEAAYGQASTISQTRDRERTLLEKEVADLRQQLELEKRRATNRATRAASAEAALRRSRELSQLSGGGSAHGGSSGGGSACGDMSSELLSSAAGSESLHGGGSSGTATAPPPDFDLCGRRALDFDVGDGGGGGGGSMGGSAPPSASVSSMFASLESERSRRIDAECSLARAEADHASECAELRASLEEATKRGDRLEEQLERKEIEAGGAPARAALRALERQLSDEKERANGAEANERAATAQLRSVLASVCHLAEAKPVATGAAEQLVVQEHLARETIRDLAKSTGGEVAEAAAGGGKASPVSQREVERCLQLIERRLHSLDAANSTALLMLEKPAATQQPATKPSTAAKQRGAAEAKGREAESAAPLPLYLTSALSDLSGGTAQSPPNRQRGKGGTAAEGRPRTAKATGGASSSQPNLARAERPSKAAAAAFDERISRAAAAAESRAAAAFEASLAAVAPPRAPSTTAPVFITETQAEAPTMALSTDAPESTPESPQPLTRDQIKAQYLERVGSKDRVDRAEVYPLQKVSSSNTTLVAPVVRPSTAGGVSSMRGRGGRGAAVVPDRGGPAGRGGRR